MISTSFWSEWQDLNPRPLGTETSALFSVTTLMPLYHAQFVSLMSVNQISGGVLYALLAVPVALIIVGIGIVISRKVFARHQVL